MNKSEILIERKDEIISSFLSEYLEGITSDGLEILQGIMSEEELNAYGYDLNERDDEEE